jgi:hypothetical protein
MHSRLQAKSAIILLVLVNCVAIPAVEAADPDPVNAKAFIIRDEETGALTARFDLGRVPVATKLDVRLSLTNLTDMKVEFDSLSTSCSCSSLSPAMGDIPQGQSQEFKFTIQLTDSPESIRSGGSVVFMKGQTPVFDLGFTYSFDAYAGFTATFAALEWEKGKQMVFRIPIVIGDQISEKDINVTVDGIPGDMRWELEQGGRVLNVSITPNTQDDPPFSGVVAIENTSTGHVSKCRLIVEAAEPVKVYPRMLRMVEDVADAKYECSFFCRVLSEDKEKPRKLVSAQATIGEKKYLCTLVGSARDTTRFQVAIPTADIEAIQEETAQATSQSAAVPKASIAFRLEIAEPGDSDQKDASVSHQSITVSVPFSFHKAD